MKKLLVTLGVLCSVCSIANANAGKPERDKKDELEPTVTAASTEVSGVCGCPIKVSVNWDSYAAASRMERIAYTIEAVTKSLNTNCAKDADKKAVCANLTEVVIYAGASTAGVDDPTYKDKVLSVQSTEVGYTNDSQINAVIGKW